MFPCPKCHNPLVYGADHCNGCGWDHRPCAPPMGFDALRAIARGRVADAEDEAERKAIQAEGRYDAR